MRKCFPQRLTCYILLYFLLLPSLSLSEDEEEEGGAGKNSGLLSADDDVTSRQLCRSRGMLLSFEDFHIDTCALCYHYMPHTQFHSRFAQWKKLRLVDATRSQLTILVDDEVLQKLHPSRLLLTNLTVAVRRVNFSLKKDLFSICLISFRSWLMKVMIPVHFSAASLTSTPLGCGESAARRLKTVARK